MKVKKVKFIGVSNEQINTMYATYDDPRPFLLINAEYIVSEIRVHDWHTFVLLEVYPNMKFNSVCFEGDCLP